MRGCLSDGRCAADRHCRGGCAGPFGPVALGELPLAMVTGLGVAWILDGLEVTLVGSLSGAIAHSPVLRCPAEVGASASAYLIGAVSGALVFGYPTDILGCKRLFSISRGAGKRAAGGGRNRVTAAGPTTKDTIANRSEVMVPGRGQDVDDGVPRSDFSGRGADGHTGVLLQCGVFHLRADSDPISITCLRAA